MCVVVWVYRRCHARWRTISGSNVVSVEVDGEPDDKDRQGLGSYYCARSSYLTFSEGQGSRVGVLTVGREGSPPVGSVSYF